MEVSATVLDRSHRRVSREIGTTVSLDSDIHNPVYELRTEFRKPNMPATSTLLLKVAHNAVLQSLSFPLQDVHNTFSEKRQNIEIIKTKK